MRQPLRTAIFSISTAYGLLLLTTHSASAFFVRQSATQCFAAMRDRVLPTVSSFANSVTVQGTNSNPPDFVISTIWCPFPETDIIQKTSVHSISAYARSVIPGGGLTISACTGFFDADGGVCDSPHTATRDSTNRIFVGFVPGVWGNNDGHFPYLIVTGIGPSAGAIVEIKGIFYSS